MKNFVIKGSKKIKEFSIKENFEDALENVARSVQSFLKLAYFFIHNFITGECHRTEINIVHDSKGNVNYMISTSLINVVKT